MHSQESILSNYKVKTQQDVFVYIKNRIDKISNYSLLLGAGASFSSGIKTGENLVDIWRKDVFTQISKDASEEYNAEIAKQRLKEFYKQDYDEDKEYSSLFKIKYDLPSQRRNFVEQEMKSAILSIGYRYLANLVEASYFNTIFTTNFDPLIEQALQEANLKSSAIVCSHDSSISSIPVVSNRPKVIKLHGDFLFDDIKTTLAETTRLERNMEDKFEEFLKNFGLIVIGYSGKDDSIMSILERLVNKEGYLEAGLYWCIRGEKEIQNNNKLQKLLRHDKCFVVKIDGFDEFMAELNDSIESVDYEKSPYKIKREKITYEPEIQNVKQRFPKHAIIQRDCANIEKSVIYRAIKNYDSFSGRKGNGEEKYNFIIDPKTRADLAAINDSLVVGDKKTVLDLISKIEAQGEKFENPMLYNNLVHLKVDILTERFKYKEAYETLEYLQKVNESLGFEEAWPIVLSAKLLLKQHNTEGALDFISEKISKYKNSYSLHLLIAEAKEKIWNDSFIAINTRDIIDAYKQAIRLNPNVRTNSAYLRLAKFIFNSKECFDSLGEENYNTVLLEPFKTQNEYDEDYIEIQIRKILFDIKQHPEYLESGIQELNKLYESCLKKGGYKYKSSVYNNYLRACRKLKRTSEFHKCVLQIPEYLKNTDWFIEEQAKYYLNIERSLPKAISILEKGTQIDDRDMNILEMLCMCYLHNNQIDLVEKYLPKCSQDVLFDLKTSILIYNKKYDDLYNISKQKFENSSHAVSDYMKYSYHLLICCKYSECLSLLESHNSKSDVLTINYELARKKLGKKLRQEKIEAIYKRQTDTAKAAAAVLLGKTAEAKNILQQYTNNHFLEAKELKVYPIFEDLFKDEQWSASF